MLFGRSCAGMVRSRSLVGQFHRYFRRVSFQSIIASPPMNRQPTTLIHIGTRKLPTFTSTWNTRRKRCPTAIKDKTIIASNGAGFMASSQFDPSFCLCQRDHSKHGKSNGEQCKPHVKIHGALGNRSLLTKLFNLLPTTSHKCPDD